MGNHTETGHSRSRMCLTACSEIPFAHDFTLSLQQRTNMRKTNEKG